MTHYNNAKFIAQHFGQNVLDENWICKNWICKRHLIEAKWHCNTNSYVPKWKSTGEQCKPVEKCCNPNCTNLEYQKLITPAFAPINEIQQVFKVEMLNVHMTTNDLKSLTDSAKCIISTAIQENRSTDNLAQCIQELLQDSNLPDNFYKFVKEQTDDTWKL